ncbi:TRAP transporter small permease subunit [Sneathiella chungangensis]|uniref:TRAP transporter small permease protein n=1 Tax=Sneathiella chungangensis TaxID=1418234 RepID=A0A845MES3_9PROT|nr:TRAP transporter small permease subunit [Sneathiella chungangensis]MZR21544.1 TRAP transporter small permease subunit [Sneathiella chungangensis]
MTMAGDVYASHRGLQYAVRVYGWCMLVALPIYFFNNFLSFTLGWPGITPIFSAGEVTAESWIQLAIFGAGIVFAFGLVSRTASRHLRDEAAMITRFNTYLVRAAFWAVFLVGIVDMSISFLRIESILPYFISDQLNADLGRAHFRGPYVHIPLIILSLLIALRSRTLGFQWLALLVVFAELLIVITRFIFSYEQAFMGDLVRFWYAALFLFASAYTLVEEGHVRVDVFYAGFTNKTKGFVNAVGTFFMGIVLCWTILFVGMGNKAAILYSPMSNFEVSQSGFGMHVKYLMAGFLAVFAVTMLIQFVSYMMEAVADYLEQPGHQDHESSLTG